MVNRHTSRTNAEGAILPLFVFLLPVLIGFIALVIDIGSAGTGKEDAGSHARMVALAALEAYVEKGGAHPGRMSSALDRANEISELNKVLGNSSIDLEVGSTIYSSKGDMPAGAPKLIPGRWFYKNLEDGTNPCASGETPPCYVGLQTGEVANALRIQGDLFEDLSFSFARLLGVDSMPLRIDEIAVVVPRHMCFLVDISPSMVRETHVLQSTSDQSYANGQGSEYAYYLQADNGGTKPGRHDSDFAWLSSQPGRGSMPTKKTVHYHDDYELITTLSDANFMSGLDSYGNSVDYSLHHPDPSKRLEMRSEEHQYRVDTYRDGIYGGPEPLTTVLRGISTAIVALKNRAVPGDKACLIFYDKGLAWTRTVNITDDFDYLLKLVDFNTLNDPLQGVHLALQHNLFPNAKSHTNMISAFSEALNQFKRAETDGIPASTSIVHFGDGLGNCASCDGVADSKYDVNGDGTIDEAGDFDTTLTDCDGMTPADPGCEDTDINGDGVSNQADRDLWSDYFFNEFCGGTNSQCSNSFRSYRKSMDQLMYFATESLVPSKTVVHMVGVGAHIAPHTVKNSEER